MGVVAEEHGEVPVAGLSGNPHKVLAEGNQERNKDVPHLMRPKSHA